MRQGKNELYRQRFNRSTHIVRYKNESKQTESKKINRKWLLKNMIRWYDTINVFCVTLSIIEDVEILTVALWIYNKEIQKLNP